MSRFNCNILINFNYALQQSTRQKKCISKFIVKHTAEKEQPIKRKEK